MFIGAFDPLRFESLTLFRFSLLLFHLLHVFSYFILIKSFLSKKITNRRIVLISLAIYTVSLNIIPDLLEHLYWFPSVTAYQFGSSLLLINAATILFRLQSRISNNSYLFLSIVLSIITIGLLELFIVPITLLFILEFIYRLKHKNSVRQVLFILLMILFASIVITFAPGNFMRMGPTEYYNLILGPYLAIKSVFYLLAYLFQHPTFVLGSILLFAIVAELLNKNEQISSFINFNYSIGYTLLFLILIPLIIFLPSTIALRSLPAGRIFDLAATLFYPVWIIFIIHFAFYYRHKYYSFKLSVFYRKLLIFLMLLFTFSGVYITNMYDFAHNKKQSTIIHGNILNAYVTLYRDAKGFDKDMTNKQKVFKQAQKNNLKTITVHPFKYHPRILLLVDWNESQYVNKWFFSWEVNYYGLDSIYIKPKTHKE
jgi:hypothetical protein